MKSGFYAYCYETEDNTLIDTFDLNDRYVPSTVDWENRETKKIGVHNYSYECNHVFSRVSYKVYRMDENDVNKATEKLEKIKRYTMRGYMNMIQNSIMEGVQFFYKYQDSEPLTCYYDDTSLLCYHSEMMMALKIDFGDKLPQGWKGKYDTLIRRYNKPDSFDFTFYEYLLPEIENKIKSGSYKEMDSFNFRYFPSIIESFSDDLKRRFEGYDTDDIGHWLSNKLRF